MHAFALATNCYELPPTEASPYAHSYAHEYGSCVGCARVDPRDESNFWPGP
jgi:hypothetical protein